MVVALAAANERILDAVRVRQVNLARFEAGEREKVLRLLHKLVKDLGAEVLSSGVGDGRKWEAELGRLEALLTFAKKTIRTAYASLGETLNDDLVELADIESAFAVRAINRGVRFELADAMLTPEQLKAIVSDTWMQGAPLSEWLDRGGQKLSAAFADQVRMGMLNGEGTAEIVRRVIGSNRKDGTVTPSILDASRTWANMMVRSAVNAVSTQARMETFRQNADVLKGVQFVATLDSRTTDICISMDGLMWDLEGNPIGHDKQFSPPPLHFGCRSALSPVTKSFRELGLDIDEVPPSTRASMDGQIPEALGFDGWLKTKDPEFVNGLLGEQRAKLWRNGKIGLSELTDQTGRPLTLEQLRRQREAWVGDYASSYLAKLKSLDDYFSGHGVLFTEHGLNRLEGRIQGGRILNRETVLDVIRDGQRYLDAKGNETRYKDGISVHFGKKDGVVLSVIPREEADLRKWNRIK